MDKGPPFVNRRDQPTEGHAFAAYVAAIYEHDAKRSVASWLKLAPLGWPKTLALLEVITAETADEWVAKPG